MMRNNLLRKMLGALLILALSPFLTHMVYAGNDKMEAGKRIIFEDNKTESMRDVYIRREAETKEYKEKILSNSEETIKLLKEIRDLLKQLCELEQDEDSY